MPKISIIVPVYKVEEYIDQCVQSLLNQTERDFEIILINDGSPDNCGEICDNYAKNHPELIRVIHQENQGVSVARNTGIVAAVGEWISFVDSDDWTSPEMFETLLSLAEATQCDICASGYVLDYSEQRRVPFEFKNLAGYELKPKDKTELYKYVLNTMALDGFNERVALTNPWAKLYRKELLIDKGIFFKKGIAMSEDAIFNMYAFELASKIVLCKGAFYYYRLHPTQVTKQHNNTLIESDKIFANEIRLFTDKFCTEEDARDIFNSRIARAFTRTAGLAYLAKDAPYTLRQRLQGIRHMANHELYKSAIKNTHLRFYSRNVKMQVFFARYRLFLFYYLGIHLVDLRRLLKLR